MRNYRLSKKSSGKCASGKKADNQGVALIIVIFALMLFAGLGWILMSVQSVNIESNMRGFDSEKALYLADAGAQWMSSQLTSNPSGVTKDTHYLHTLNFGQYDVFYRDSNTALGEPAGATVILATGYIPTQQSYLAMRQVELIVTVSNGYTLNNVLVSSGSLTMSGNSDITTGSGDVYVDGSFGHSGNSNIDGNSNPPDPNDYTGSLPPVVVPAALVSLPNLGTLSSSTTLGPGNYKYSAISLGGNNTVTITGPANIYLTDTTTSLSLSGNSNLIIAGNNQVNIYIEGALSISGNAYLTNNSHNPYNLIIYGTPTDNKTITLSGNGDFYGVIYAPSTNMNISGNGNYDGAYTGSNITMSGNASMNYDSSLSNKTLQLGGGSSSTTYVWQEA